MGFSFPAYTYHIYTLSTSYLIGGFMRPDHKHILTILKIRLSGKCSTHVYTCPKRIARQIESVWECEHCMKYFSFIDSFQKEIQTKSNIFLCPCFQAQKGFINGDELMLAVDEYIID